MGIFAGNTRYDNPNWSELTHLVANEFDTVTAIALFRTVQLCPPRWMVDPATEPNTVTNQFYNDKIADNILLGYSDLDVPNDLTFPCREPLDEALDTEDWSAYEALAKPNYSQLDRVVAWAKREQQRGHPVYVHINPLLWDFHVDGVSPSWFRGDVLSNTGQYEDWTREERRSILGLMESHIKGLITRYCTPSVFLEVTPTVSPTPPGNPTPSATPTHTWTGTKLNGVVSVYEVFNEVTQNDNVGSVRQMDGSGVPVSWAIVNPLVNTGSDVYDEELDDAYPGQFFTDYHVYQAFLYAKQAADSNCTGSNNRGYHD